MASSQALVLEDESNLGAGGPRFSPPLYKQRYSAVLEVVRKLKPCKVVDYGCAECKLLRILKKEDCIEVLVGVDLDPVPLVMHADMIRPLITDYLHRRPRPLNMALMEGSIAIPDARLVDFDLLTCIEVVEHLEQPVLDALPLAILGQLCPRAVVMTTPNSEYNVLFPGFRGYRHHDHKFEWTRNQFQTWCEEVSRRYGYTVEHGGIGAPTPGREDVGQCSQMAIFTRSWESRDRDTGILSPYKVIAEAVHPHQTNPLTVEEKLRLECEYYCRVLSKARRESEGYDNEEGACRIGLEELLVFPRVKGLCSSVEDIRKVLVSNPSPSLLLDPVADCAVFLEQEWEAEGEDLEEQIAAISLQESLPAHVSTNKECWD